MAMPEKTTAIQLIVFTFFISLVSVFQI